MTFPEKLQAIRNEKGLSQKKLADLMGISQTAIYSWEKGKMFPKIEQLQKLSIALGVSISDLVDPETLNITNDLLLLFNNKEVKSTSASTNDSQEKYLISKFRELNTIGKNKVVSYAEDMTKLHEYTDAKGE